MKPKPPKDLWERLEADLKELKQDVAERPPGAFSMKDFAARFKISQCRARRRLEKLIEAGNIERIGRSGPLVRYVYVDRT